jgi:hypothetical protein
MSSFSTCKSGTVSRLITLALLLAIPVLSLAQEQEPAKGAVQVRGIVLDAQNLKALEATQVFLNNNFVFVTDSEGKFSIKVNRNDTVVFTRLGYTSGQLVISDTLRGDGFLAGIYMNPDTLAIGEVVIIPRLASLKTEILGSPVKRNPEMDNARYNLALSAYQGRVTGSRLGDPAINYELLRQKHINDAYTKGQIPPDRMVGISPLILIPAVYLLMHGMPEQPDMTAPELSESEVSEIHRKYIERVQRK